MNTDTNEIIENYLGKHKPFKQIFYILINEWHTVDVTKRKGAWIGNKKNSEGKIVSHGLSHGVCAGLVCAYLMFGKSWDSFDSYIMSEQGKNLVRGVMNFQKQSSANHSSGHHKKTIQADDIITEILKINGIRFIKQHVFSIMNLKNELRRDVLQNLTPSLGYIIVIRGPSISHVVSIRTDGGKIKFFDPNHGEFIFPYRNGNCEGMVVFIMHHLSLHYRSLTFISAQRYITH